MMDDTEKQAADMPAQLQTEVQQQTPQYDYQGGVQPGQHGAPPVQYGAPPAQYGAPSAQHGAPPVYGSPSAHHAVPYPQQQYNMQGQPMHGQPMQGQQAMYTPGAAPVQASAGFAVRPTSSGVACNPSLSPLAIIGIIKIVCWLATLISASVALAALDDYSIYRYATSSLTSPTAYMVAISVITFVVDIALLVMTFIGTLSTMTNSQSTMTYTLMAYNALCIFLYYIALRLGTVGFSPHISFWAFAGIGIAACATELSIHVNVLKEIKGAEATN